MPGRSAAGRTSAVDQPVRRLQTFDTTLELLRNERVVVLTGAPFTGRRTAALKCSAPGRGLPVRILDPDTSPTALAHQLSDAQGYLLSDLITDHHQPLRESHLRAVQEKLAEHGGYLVITAGLHIVFEDTVRTTPWRPPTPATVLKAHLGTMVTEDRSTSLLGLGATRDFLAREHQLREVVAFARKLAAHAHGETSAEELERFSLATVERQVQEWFDEESVSLHDKAFLIALAAFDEGPYALTAELSDLLYGFLLNIEAGGLRAKIPCSAPPSRSASSWRAHISTRRTSTPSGDLSGRRSPPSWTTAHRWHCSSRCGPATRRPGPLWSDGSSGSPTTAALWCATGPRLPRRYWPPRTCPPRWHCSSSPGPPPGATASAWPPPTPSPSRICSAPRTSLASCTTGAPARAVGSAGRRFARTPAARAGDPGGGAGRAVRSRPEDRP